MKHSIKKRIIGFILITITMVMLIFYFLADYSVSWMLDTFYDREGNLAASLVANAYDLHDEAGTKRIKEVCEEHLLAYAYTYQVDVEKSEIVYRDFVAGSVVEENVYKDIIIGKTKKIKINSEEMSVLNGEKRKAVYEGDNKYGHVHSYIEGIYDKEGNCIAIAGVDILVDQMEHKFWSMFAKAAITVSIMFAFVMTVILIILQKLVFNPIIKIKNHMEEFVSGEELNYDLMEVKGQDELSTIARSFNNVKLDIKKYIETVEVLNKEKQVQQLEMDMAANIQKQMLPPVNSTNGNIEIGALMKPAKTVGGDFYNYMYLDDDTWALVIADVSGKGAFAAMFMAKAVTILSEIAKTVKSPSEILEHVNNSLAQNNEELLFVTMFLAIYHGKDQVLTYSNAGHNVPYIITKDGVLEMNCEVGCALGLFEGEAYVDAQRKIEFGDTLYLYTDGVNEAVNEKKEFFGTQRLLDILNNYKHGKTNASVLIDNMVDKMNEFCGDANQHDDITMLAARFEKTWKLDLAPELSSLPKIKDIIVGNATIPERIQKQIYLAVEEIFVNIVSYGYEGVEEKGRIFLTLKTINNSIYIEFIDSAKQYNPLEEVKEPDEFDELIPGGLGKFIAFTIMDKQEYQYENGKNILTLLKDNI